MLTSNIWLWNNSKFLCQFVPWHVIILIDRQNNGSYHGLSIRAIPRIAIVFHRWKVSNLVISQFSYFISNILQKVPKITYDLSHVTYLWPPLWHQFWLCSHINVIPICVVFMIFCSFCLKLRSETTCMVNRSRPLNHSLRSLTIYQ